MTDYKQYSKFFQDQKQDSPLVLRDNEIIIKRERYDELCSVENKLIYVERLLGEEKEKNKLNGLSEYGKEIIKIVNNLPS